MSIVGSERSQSSVMMTGMSLAWRVLMPWQVFMADVMADMMADVMADAAVAE